MKFESQLQIVTAAGVPPLTVNQTALVINLNADYLDGQHGAYYLDCANFTGTLAAARLSGSYNINVTGTAQRITDQTTGSLRLANPTGASYATGVATVTGAIKIKLPTASFKSATMLRFTVRIYEYSGGAAGTSRTIEVGGYNYNDAAGNWYNYFATQSTMGGSDINVRFGNDGTSQCIWIGETTTAWSYPQVTVTDFQAGYNSYTDAIWGTGWAISFATVFDTVTQGPIVAAKPLTSQNFTSYTLPLSGGTLTGGLTGTTASFSGQITSTVATGTAPLSITSTTLVTNLNADYLDGQHGSYYENRDATALGFSGGTLTLTRAAGNLSVSLDGRYMPLTGGTISGNLTITGTLTEGGYLAFPERVYTVDLTAGSANSFYPIVINGSPGSDLWHHRFSLEMPGQGGGAAYNMDHLHGEARGQGWSDQTGFYRVFHNCYDNAERSILGIWRGTQDFYGIVIYVRGGQNYYVRTNSRSVVGYTAATTQVNSTFAIKNSAGADVSGTSVAIGEMLNLINTPQGFHSSYNNYIGGTQVVTNSGTWAISISGTAATATNVAWTGVTGKPTTLSGYGITDALPLTGGTLTGALSGTTASFSGSVTSITLGKTDVSTALASTSFAKWLFATSSTAGVLDWNDASNTMPGVGNTLLLGTATNGPGVSSYFHPLNIEYAGNGGTGNVTQMAVSYGAPANELYMRGRYSTTWTSWVRFLNSSNYSAYALPLSGGTLTGNLALNTGVIFNRGSAPSITNIQCSIFNELNGIASAESLNFRAYGGFKWQYWDGSATWMQLTSSGLSITGTLSATGAITQNGNQVLHAGNYTSYRGVQLVSPNGGTVVAADSAMPDAANSFIHTLGLGPSGNDGHILGMTWTGTSAYGAQIWIDTDPNNRMAFRSRSSTGVWTGWNELIHSSNYSSYALPLSGGTMTGQLNGQYGPALSFYGNACDAASYNYVLGAANDGGNKLVIFVNGSTRSADGGVNSVTIRNDGGPLNLGSSSYATAILGSSVTIGGNVALHAGNYTSYAFPITATTAYPITGQTKIKAGHGTTRLQLHYNHDNNDDSANAGFLTMWASEPGISYPYTGIGGNINIAGQHYGRQGSGLAYGVYIRFNTGDGYTEFWNTTGAPGVASGQGTRRAYIAQDGELYATANAYKVVHAGNFSSYALPLSGGTMTGDIIFANDSVRAITNAAGNAGFRPDDAYGNTYMWNYAANAGWYGDFTSFNWRTAASSLLMSLNSSALNSLVAIQQNGNQVLHAGNYTSVIGYTPAYGTGAYQTKSLDTISTPGLYQYDGGFGGTKPPDNSPNYRTIEIGNGNRFSQIAMPWNSDGFYFRRQEGATFSSWRTVLHDGNFPSINTYGTSIGNTLPDRVFMSNDANIKYAPRDTAKAHLGLTGKYGNSRPNQTTDSNYWTGVMGWGTTDWNAMFDWGSGFVDSWSGPANNPGDTSHHVGVQAIHYTNGSGRYGWQMCSGAGTNRWWLRDVWGGSFSSWREILHSANYMSYALPLSGGTVTGLTSFTASESINAKGIRGQFTNEYLQLYNKVGIGNPSGWGTGEANTPIYGISTYGGMRIAYGNSAASIVYGALDVQGALTQNSSQVLHASNYTSYAAAKDGNNATGTWPVSISASAAQLNGQAASYYENRDTTSVSISAGTLTLGRGAGNLTTTIGGRVVAWCDFNGNFASSQSPNASFNVSSITKNATGDYTVNFSSSLGTANYVVAGTAQLDTPSPGASNYNVMVAVPRRSGAKAAGSCRVVCEYPAGVALYDSISVGVAFIAA